MLKEEKVLSIKLKCTGTGGTVELKWNRFIKLVLGLVLELELCWAHLGLTKFSCT